MSQPENTDCTEMLLDLVCHEMRRKTLTPEMERLFLDHLAECVECRTKVLGFMEVLGGWYQPFIAQIGVRN